MPRQVGAGFSPGKRAGGSNSRSPATKQHLRNSSNASGGQGMSGMKNNAADAIRGNVDIK